MLWWWMGDYAWLKSSCFYLENYIRFEFQEINFLFDAAKCSLIRWKDQGDYKGNSIIIL